MSKEIEVEQVTLDIPKHFVVDLQEREWFKQYYSDLEEFLVDAARRLKHYYTWGDFGLNDAMRNLVETYRQAKAEDPTLTFREFMETGQEDPAK